jgi:hypothetical protein
MNLIAQNYNVILSVSSESSNKTISRAGVAMLEDRNDYMEPDDGIFAIPAPKTVPYYNMAELFYYCQRVNKKPMELTEEEKKKFIISEE